MSIFSAFVDIIKILDMLKIIIFLGHFLKSFMHAALLFVNRPILCSFFTIILKMRLITYFKCPGVITVF